MTGLPVPDFGADARAAGLYTRFEAAGQGHVFAFWNRLETDQRQSLVAQLESVDLAQVALLTNMVETRHVDTRGDSAAGIMPPDIALPPATDAEREAWDEARQHGEDMLRAGRVAALTVAGGQATRLGLDMPKGCLSFGPVTGISLFGIYARQIAAVGERYGQPMPWLVMTSAATHDDTVAFFEKHEFFGLDRERVRFFSQGMQVALTSDGKLLLDAPDRVSTAPDGHGGVLAALRRDSLLGWLAGLRCDTLSYFQVDNVQARVADPVFIGLHTTSGCEFSTKIVKKTDPSERVGLVVRRSDNRLGIVEYSDLSGEAQSTRDANGDLRFRAANTAIHLIDVPFIASITNKGAGLGWHVAHKKVPHIDLATAGQPGEVRRVEPDEPNAFKFEQFIFDAMPLAPGSGVVMQVDRDAEFLPIKSADGPTSPQAVSAAYQRYWAGTLRGLGADVPVNDDGNPRQPVEVAPRFLLDGEWHETLRKRIDRGFDTSGPIHVE